jgi:hypothetical protein
MTQTIPFSRRLCARAVAATTQKRFASGNKRGRRSAERRMPTIAAHHQQTLPSADGPRGSAPFRGALAFRRFTAALARPNASSLGSAPVPAFPETRLDGRYPRLPVSSLPSSSETGRRAGRAVAQSRPGAVCETARGDRTRSTLRIASGMRPSNERAGVYVT